MFMQISMGESDESKNQYGFFSVAQLTRSSSKLQLVLFWSGSLMSTLIGIIAKFVLCVVLKEI